MFVTQPTFYIDIFEFRNFKRYFWPLKGDLSFNLKTISTECLTLSFHFQHMIIGKAPEFHFDNNICNHRSVWKSPLSHEMMGAHNMSLGEWISPRQLYDLYDPNQQPRYLLARTKYCWNRWVDLNVWSPQNYISKMYLYILFPVMTPTHT